MWKTSWPSPRAEFPLVLQALSQVWGQQLPVLPCWFWVWWLVQAQLSEPHGAGEATPSPARLDHSSCQSYLHPPGSRISFFQQDPQQDTVSLDHSGSQALVQLVWPCHGQVSTLAPHSRTWQLVLPRGAPLVPRQDGSTLQGAEQLFCVPGCAWRPWRWEQGRKDAHPVGYKAFPSSAVPSGVCMCSHCIRAHHSTSMIWALENLGTFLL